MCGVLFLATTLNYLDRVALNQTAARIKLAFQLNDEQYGLLESGFAFAFAIGTLTAGWLVDRTSVRWVYPVAVVGWSLAGFLTGFAPTYWALFACRVALGGFEAANWPCGVRTVRQVMPPAERSLGNALFQSGTAIGAILTPLVVLACVRWADPGEAARNAHLAAGGGMAVAVTGDPPAAWQWPFRVIGAVGLVWVLLWVFTVPKRALDPLPEPAGTAAEPSNFLALLRDRRFWVLVAVIIGVNTSWHTFRVWLPLFLQKRHGFSEGEMSWFTTGYYLTADVGSWTVGLAALLLTKRGLSVHAARVWTFAGCLPLVVAAAAVPWLERGPPLTVALFAFGFGALGLFPTYFALSQTLSAKHQGKVTGLLGFINALYLTVLFWVEGRVCDRLGRYDPVLAVAWVPAAVALIAVLLFWPKSRPESG